MTHGSAAQISKPATTNQLRGLPQGMSHGQLSDMVERNRLINAAAKADPGYDWAREQLGLPLTNARPGLPGYALCNVPPRSPTKEVAPPDGDTDGGPPPLELPSSDDEDDEGPPPLIPRTRVLARKL